MRNIEKLRNYFLGKDPQLNETMADNSLRLIGIPGREYVLRVELLKRLGLLKKELTDKDEELQGLIDDLETALNGLSGDVADEETARINEDLAINRRVDRNAVDIANLDTWKNNTDFVLANDLATALSDYYTKEQIDEIISVLPTFDVRVVEQLPAPIVAEQGVLYLVPSSDPGDVNYYDEYIVVAYQGAKSWEKVGSTAIDMLNYYTKSETDALLNTKQGTLTPGDYIDIINGEISVTGIVPETTEINNYVADTSIEGATGFPIEFYPNYTNYTYCSYTNTSNNEETYSFKVKGSIVDSSIIYRADANGIALYVDSTYQAMWEDYHDVQLTLPAGGTAYFQFYYNPDYPDPSFPQPSVLMASSDGAVLNNYTRFSDTFIGTDGNTDGAPGVVPAPTSGDTNKYLKSDGTWGTPSGGGGTSDYADLTNKPQINGVTLTGDKTTYGLLPQIPYTEMPEPANPYVSIQDLVDAEGIYKTDTTVTFTGGNWSDFPIHPNSIIKVSQHGSTRVTVNVIIIDWDNIVKCSGRLTVATDTWDNFEKKTYATTDEIPTITYSTTERVVGTWINGKPLYEKVIREQMPITSTMGTWASRYVYLDNDVENVIVMSATLDRSGEGTPKIEILPIVRPLTSGGNLTGIIRTQFEIVLSNQSQMETGKTKAISLMNSDTGVTNSYAVLVIRYTKTTD